MGKAYPRFQTEGSKTLPFVAAYAYMAYIREYAPGIEQHSSSLKYCQERIIW